VFGDMEELIRLGAYRRGSDPQVDEAIHLNPDLEDFLRQDREESSTLAEGYSRLAEIVGGPQRQ
jgi:flagellum-specific ATP synthase